MDPQLFAVSSTVARDAQETRAKLDKPGLCLTVCAVSRVLSNRKHG